MDGTLTLGNLAMRGDLQAVDAQGRTVTVRYRGLSEVDVIEWDGTRTHFRYLSEARSYIARVCGVAQDHRDWK